MISERTLFVAAIVAWLGLSVPSQAQLDKQTILAFRHIRDDEVPHNGEAAQAWLMANRQRLKEAITEELERTDQQGRGVLVAALMANKDFQPDTRFYKRVLTYVNGAEDPLGDVRLAAWPFFDRHYSAVRPLLIENLNSTTSMTSVVETTVFLAQRKQLEKELPNFGPHVWELAAASLRDDDKYGNAGEAIEFYLTLGKLTLPRLKELAASREAQTHDYATAMIDAMDGKRRAYGYLASQTPITGGPAWLGAEVDRWDPHAGPRKHYR